VLASHWSSSRPERRWMIDPGVAGPGDLSAMSPHCTGGDPGPRSPGIIAHGTNLSCGGMLDRR
jgi:hypothetical protein